MHSAVGACRRQAARAPARSGAAHAHQGGDDERSRGFESLCLAATPAGVEVVGFSVDSLKKYEGKRLTEIAATWRKDWPDALMDLTFSRAIGSAK